MQPAPDTGAPAQWRRAQILCASVEVVARDGADRARLKDIADQAGVSLGLVQHYFRTRRDLMEQTFETMMSISLRAWAELAAAESDPLVVLFAGLRLHVVGSVTFPDRWGFWVELWATARRDPALTRIAHQVYERWSAPFQHAIAGLSEHEGTRPIADPDAAALVVMALVDGLAVRTVVDPEVLSAEGMFDYLVQSVTAILAIESGASEEATRSARALFDRGGYTEPLSPELIMRVLDEESPREQARSEA